MVRVFIAKIYCFKSSSLPFPQAIKLDYFIDDFCLKAISSHFRAISSHFLAISSHFLSFLNLFCI